MFMCDRTCDLFKVGNFNIKRCLLFLVCIMLLVACGENDPIESRNRHPRQQEESYNVFITIEQPKLIRNIRV
jgi:hypothetical protein